MTETKIDLDQDEAYLMNDELSRLSQENKETPVPGLQAKIKYKEDEGAAHNEDYHRDESVKAAAKDLLAALKGLLSDKYLADPINADRMTAARLAVDKAEPWRKPRS